MSITINWTDLNLTVTKFRVYRQTTPILPGALPAVLAEVAAGTYTYIDTTAVRNTLYYYVVSTVVGTEETLSANMPLAYMPYTGPGPQKLLRGDWSYGTFGRMNPEDLFGALELISLCGLPAAMYTAGAGWLFTCWTKIVANGKILYIPDLAVGYNYGSLSLGVLYGLGLVYGTDASSTWNAAMKTSMGTIPQNFQLNKNADNFIVRLPGSKLGAVTFGGELDQVISPMFQQHVQTFSGAAVDDLLYAGNLYAITKDAVDSTGNSVIYRGGVGTQVDQVYIAAWTSTSVQYSWRPVLELVL